MAHNKNKYLENRIKRFQEPLPKKPKFEIASKNSYHITKNTILGVIVAVVVVVIGFCIFNLIATPEFLVKREVESIVADYYENYFYPTLLKNNSIDPEHISDSIESKSAINNVFSKYADHGFYDTSFNQLLHYDDLKHISSSAKLSEYCDLENSRIRIYPEHPFGSKNYRVEYTYSCNF